MAQNTTSQKKIVILGGSYSGTSIAHYLLKHTIPHLPNKSNYQIILISTSSQAMCRPACPRALISDSLFPQEKLFVDIPSQFSQYPKENFHFIQGTAKNLNHTTRTVTITLPSTTTDSLTFHTLIIATGASTPSPLLGLNHSSDFLRSSWADFRKALPAAKSIIIVGGGPAGIETAGELGEHLNGRASWFQSKLKNPKVPITVLTAGPSILPLLRPAIAQTAEGLLAKVGVTVIKNARVKSVSPEAAGTRSVASKATLTLEDGKVLEADLYIPATGMTPNSGFVDKSLLTPDGRINTNASTFRVDAAGPRIYAVGDVASAARPAVHLILNAIPVLGANVKRDLLLDAGAKGVGEDRQFVEDKRETQMVPIGKSKGVGAAMGWALPSWAVWAIKGRDYFLWTTGALWSGKQWSKES